MDMTAKDIELEIYRSGLLKSDARPHHVTQRCKVIKKHAARYDRARLQLCNGIERWDSEAWRVVASLTEKDETRLDAVKRDAREHIADELRAMLKRGTVLDFRSDPRAAICRFVNKANTRDGWIS